MDTVYKLSSGTLGIVRGTAQYNDTWLDCWYGGDGGKWKVVNSDGQDLDDADGGRRHMSRN